MIFIRATKLVSKRRWPLPPTPMTSSASCSGAWNGRPVKMAQFKYTARNSAGKTIEGVIEAPAQKSAVDKLRGQRMIVVALNEMKGDGTSFWARINPIKPGVKSKDLVVFSRQLATLVSAGVPIVQGLNIFTEQLAS